MKQGLFEGRRGRAVALALVVVASTASRRSALADMIVPPPPDCVGQPAGARCVRFNGTAGRCVHTPDPRRPSRVNIVCEADESECASLAIGAACHGYLGRAAHCREFSDEQTHRRWRACVVDENQPDATPTPAPTPAPTPPAPTPPAPTPPAATPPAPPARSSGCSVTLGSDACEPAVIAVGLALCLAMRRRRRATR